MCLPAATVSSGSPRRRHVARVAEEGRDELARAAHALIGGELHLHAGRDSGTAGFRFEGGGGGAGKTVRRAPQSLQATLCGKFANCDTLNMINKGHSDFLASLIDCPLSNILSAVGRTFAKLTLKYTDDQDGDGHEEHGSVLLRDKGDWEQGVLGEEEEGHRNKRHRGVRW